MPVLDPRIDSYLDTAPGFAQTILRELRRRVHAACPGVVETIKWSTPAFEHHGLLGGIAAFKSYCTFAFWKEKLLLADPALRPTVERLGKMVALADLPAPRVCARVFKRAAELNEQGIVAPRAAPKAKPRLVVPKPFAAALARHAAARRHFEAFPPSQRREYVEWIAAAKREATQARRIEQAVAWLAAGRHRNWKYER